MPSLQIAYVWHASKFTREVLIPCNTEDSFETIFAVNHLAHYLLARLLMPHLANEATVLFTTSDMHDAGTNPIAPSYHADAHRLAHPQPEPGRKSRPFIEGIQAYPGSKLCNVLTARALASLPSALTQGLHVIAYNPGFTPGTNLSRSGPLAVRTLSSREIHEIGSACRAGPNGRRYLYFSGGIASK